MASADRLIEIFNGARTRPAGAEREQFLAEACRDDLELKNQVLSLLRAHEGAGDFLNPTLYVSPVSSLTEKPGDRIGRYKLLQQIGEGGCGVVYMAEQEEPVRRRVALKVIKLGMDTKSVIARFEAERQALALMDHPNIAKVFDAGATETGRPFFVMELVRGIKITDYCDQNNLSTEERLNLFTQVCHAIQHAHQKGVIHRDIKPSNILVTISEPGAAGCPKVIDFGIAKATNDQRLTDKTVFTAFEQFIGTPAYMSPEQAMMTSLDVDTRTDIYALGVLLYELLTGRTPFDGEELLRFGLDEMRRIIREREPARPSTRLSTLLAADLTRVAQHRQAEPGRLGTLLSGDLDWIVMKCLEKERSRRYETASGLAADVQRHLSNEPVVARPPSTGYRFRKLVRRNKLACAATGAVVTALLMGAAVSIWQANRADQARLRAEADQKKAQSEAARSRQVAKFLQDMLNGVGPSVARGRDTAMLKEILDNTAARVNVDLAGQPGVEADLRTTIGLVYRELGEFERAEAMLREALAIRRRLLGQTHPEVAESLANLGGALRGQRRFVEAEAVQREALGIRRRHFGEEHLSVAASLNSVGNELRARGSLLEAEAFHRQALAMRIKLLGKDHLDVAASRKSLALTVVRLGKRAEGEQLHREALAIRRHLLAEHLDVADSLEGVATVLEEQRKLTEAEALFRESIEMRRKLDPEHPGLARALFLLANTLDLEENLDEAEQCQREALTIFRKRLSGYHPDLAEHAKVFGLLLCRQGKLAEAEALFRETIAELEKRPAGADETDYWVELGRMHNQLGILLGNTGREAEGKAHLQKATEVWRAHPQEAWIVRVKRTAPSEPNDARRLEILGEAHLSAGEWQEAIDSYAARDRMGGSAREWFPLAFAHRQMGHMEEARVWFYKGLEWMDARQELRLRKYQAEAAVTLGLPDPWVRSRNAANHVLQADAFRRKGEKQNAAAQYHQAIELYKSLAADFPMVSAYQMRLGKAFERIDRPREAEAAYRAAVTVRRAAMGEDHLDVAEALHRLALKLREQGKFAEAEIAARDALRIRRKQLKAGDSAIGASLKELNNVLQAQGKPAEPQE